MKAAVKAAESKMRGPPKAKAKAKTDLFIVKWCVCAVIEQFGDGAFDDCYGDERDDAEEMYRDELEADETGRSDVTYCSAAKASAAAEKKFAELMRKYYWLEQAVEGEDDDQALSRIDRTTSADGTKSWSWEYDAEGGDADNLVSYSGFVRAERIRVV